MSMQWFEKRFEESASKIRCACDQCGRAMWFPPSKAGKYLTCGDGCKRARLNALRELRRRECLTCGAEFYPRAVQIASGGGKYCCVKCAEPVRALGRTPEAARLRGMQRRAAHRAGLWIAPSGPLSHSWKGGKEARKARIDTKLRAEKRRAYLRANPEKAREWAKRRKGAMGSRLPRGTVKRIGELQRWKCAVCRTGIRGGYHLDHINPLARGGLHAPWNLQLLCPPCNVRKSAKHPIDFMRERGFLL